MDRQCQEMGYTNPVSYTHLNDFCEVMGYERTKLQRKLTEKQLDFLFSNQRPVYITEALEEKEREDFSRLKVIKRQISLYDTTF